MSRLRWKRRDALPASRVDSAAGQRLVYFMHFVVLETHIHQLLTGLYISVSSTHLFIANMADIEAIGRIPCRGNALVKESRSI